MQVNTSLVYLGPMANLFVGSWKKNLLTELHIAVCPSMFFINLIQARFIGEHCKKVGSAAFHLFICFQFCLDISALSSCRDFLPWWTMIRTVSWNKPFSSQIAFSYDVFLSNRKHTSLTSCHSTMLLKFYLFNLSWVVLIFYLWWWNMCYTVTITTNNQ